MRTRQVLRAAGKAAPEFGDGPLASIRDELVTAFRANEQTRMAKARERAENGVAQPHLAALRRMVAEASSERLQDNAAPAVTRADFHALVRDAKTGEDNGISRLATHAYRLWTQDPQGSLTVGDIARLRAHYATQYPRSKVAHVIDQELPRVGFNTLPLGKLARIAAEISRVAESGDADLQNAYEAGCVAHGLDTNNPVAFRSRAFLRSLLDPQGFSVDAQVDDDAPSEEAEIVSPISGEPLHIELDAPELDTPELDAPDEDEMMEHIGQLESFEEAVVVMEDPTTEDEMLEVSVRPLEDAGPQPAREDVLETEELMDDDMEKDANPMAVGLGMALGDVLACGHERDAGDCDESCNSRMAFTVTVEGQPQPIDQFEALNMTAAFRRMASFGVRGSIKADPAKLGRLAYVVMEDGTTLRVSASKTDHEMEGKDEPFTVDINEQAEPRMDVSDEVLSDGDMGKQRIEGKLLDESIVKKAGWELTLDEDAQVHLAFRGKRKKSASLLGMDSLLDEFIEVTRPKSAASDRHAKYALYAGEGDYVLVTDLPKTKSNRERQITAKQILKALQEVSPGARGTLRKDAKLQVNFSVQAEKQLNRIRNILENRYRVAEFEVKAQSMPDTMNPQTPPGTALPPQQPAMPMQPSQPTQPQQVGQPQQPVQPQQAGFEVEFEDEEGTKGSVNLDKGAAKTAADAKAIFERFNPDCRVLRVAQLDDLMADPDPMAEAPMVEEAPSTGGLMDAETEDAVRAALTHYRNQGLGPASALDQLMSQYSDMFDRFGDKTDSQRHEVEANCMKLAAEIWQEPGMLEREAQLDSGRAMVRIINPVTVDEGERGSESKMRARKFMQSMDEVIDSTAKALGAQVTYGGGMSEREYLFEGANKAEVETMLAPYIANNLPFDVRSAEHKNGLPWFVKVSQYEPQVNEQQDDYVEAENMGPDSETHEGEDLEAPEINQQIDPAKLYDAQMSDTDLGPDSETKDPGTMGADEPGAHPDQPGVSHADTSLGADSETDDKVNELFDEVAEKGTDAFRSGRS